jgi:hypothetical protein
MYDEQFRLRTAQDPASSWSLVDYEWPFSLPCKYLQGSENGRVVTIGIVMPLIGPYSYILKGPEIFLDVLNSKYL